MKVERYYFGTPLAIRAVGWRWRWTRNGPWHCWMRHIPMNRR